MDRDAAVKYLMGCVADPAYTEATAEELWRQYRDKCAALPERDATAPESLPLSPEEKHHTTRFLAALNKLGGHGIKDFVKVDLGKLVVHQLSVVTSRSNEQYLNHVRSMSGWLHQALPLEPRPPAQFTSKIWANGLNTFADFDVPHGEFIFSHDPTVQFFSVQQFQAYISAMRGPGGTGSRLMLKAGYHRSYARARSMMLPTATVPSAVVALERDTFGEPPNQVGGAGLTVDTAGLCPTGCRPPLFADFFNDDLAMRVTIRKKRYQLQMRSTWVELDV
jgi:hypothetical protein